MKPLSIVHTESSLGWGGQEIRILTEITGMMARGHKVTLLTPEAAEIFPAAKKLGIRVVAIDIAKKRISGVLALRHWLREHDGDIDIVNSHSSTDSWLAALALSTLSMQKKPALIRTRHVSTPINNSPFTRWLYMTASAHIVTTGEALRTQLHTQNNYPLDKLTSVRTGIDLNRFRPLDKISVRRKLGVKNCLTLGVLATLRDWKGHEDLLNALVLLRNDVANHQWQLLIVGDGPERERLIAKIAARGLNDVVSLVGNKDNVPEWLSAMDIFVLPSYGNEGVPQGIMQAMACGLPVVATPVGAVGEAVSANESGLLVATRNPAMLADALGKLMRDQSLRETMGATGHEIAQAKFGVDVMVDKMEQVFRQNIKP